MGSQEVKLVSFWVSPFAKRVDWALKLKGIEFEYIEEDVFNKSNLLLELNPVHKKLLSQVSIAMCSNGDEKEKGVSGAKEAMEKIEEEIKGKKFFGGDNIGYLDLALGWISYLIPVLEEVGFMQIIDPLTYPAITTWMTNFLNHPVIKDSLPPRDNMLVYFQGFMAGLIRSRSMS